MPTFNAQTADCLVFTFKEGLLSPIAHDLKIRVESFEITVDDANPPSIQARFDAKSLKVVTAMRDGVEALGDLTENDRRKIDDETRKAVLKAKRHPEVRFKSRSVSAQGEGVRVQGDLDLVGRSRAIGFTAREVGTDWVAEIDIHQPDFGIKPYKALLGTLKIKPTIRVRVTVPGDQINMP